MLTEEEFQKNCNRVCREIETLKSSCTQLTYLQCIVEVGEDNNIEPEVLSSMLSKPIKDKLEAEASELNLLKTKNKTII